MLMYIYGIQTCMCADLALLETSADLVVNVYMLGILRNSDALSGRRIDKWLNKGCFVS